ncbi:MAG: DUF2065 domain-containing protein [Burkholderiaceae bacterium]
MADVATSFVIAFGLVLIIEGIVPLIMPSLWKDTFRRITSMEDGQLRFIGLMAVVSGVMVLLAMHAF